MSKDKFVILHTAEPVVYLVDNFIAKNNDSLPKLMTEIMVTSKRDIVSAIFRKDTGKVLPTTKVEKLSGK